MNIESTSPKLRHPNAAQLQYAQMGATQRSTISAVVAQAAQDTLFSTGPASPMKENLNAVAQGYMETHEKLAHAEDPAVVKNLLMALHGLDYACWSPEMKAFFPEQAVVAALEECENHHVTGMMDRSAVMFGADYKGRLLFSDVGIVGRGNSVDEMEYGNYGFELFPQKTRGLGGLSCELSQLRSFMGTIALTESARGVKNPGDADSDTTLLEFFVHKEKAASQWAQNPQGISHMRPASHNLIGHRRLLRSQNSVFDYMGS